MLRIENMKCNISLGVIFSFFTLVVAIIALVMVPKANAITAFSWISDDPEIQTKDENYSQHNYNISRCTKQRVHIGSPSSSLHDICVYQADGFRYGIAKQQAVKDFVIGFPGDSAMYPVSGLPTEDIVFTANSKHLVYRALVPGSSSAYYLYIVKNLPSQLTRILKEDLTTGYELKQNGAQRLLNDEHGNRVTSRAVDASSNGKWLVTELLPDKLVRISMENLSLKLFSNYAPPFYSNAEFSVSDNGKFVATTGSNISSRVHELNDQCGRDSIPGQETVPLFMPAGSTPGLCPEREIQKLIENVNGGGSQTLTSPRFNLEGGELLLRADSDAVSRKQWMILTANGYVAQKLDYLALGDSYSSGEGDTAKNPSTNKKYYRNYTDNEENVAQSIPREKCHISTRSYPYLLAQKMNLALDDPKQWNTLTCSGAISKDVYDSTNSNYLGQGGRLAGYNAQELKAQALNEMIPGRERQIEFVKKYQPKVITLTMGGNDVGFGDKLGKCIGDPRTCDIVNDQKTALASEILAQYNNLRTLYDELYKASNFQAKIYVLGYPQFINGDAVTSCGVTNVWLLNSEEREMITNSVTYLNNVIKKATASAGVKYIDIENSLSGHRMCDAGEKFVSGIIDPLNWNDNKQESFHPNAHGHDAITRTVLNQQNTKGQNLLDYDICPNTMANKCPDDTITKESIEIPAYFNNVTSQKNILYTKMTLSEHIKDTVVNITTGLYSLAPNSVAGLTLHSDPIDLGEYLVDSEGLARINIEIPSSIPTGYHTLILGGTSFSGEPVEYEQIILIKGSNPNDIDDDGTPDSADKCMFVTAANIDMDGDGIDDGCDPDIGAPKEPYRIRAGTPSSNEDPQRFYIERNIYATDQTGVSGDYDLNQDGWVVVASSQNITRSTPYSHFWIDNNHVPHVSIRTPENGCVQYKPANLSKVTDISPRLLIQETKDTSTCREQSIDADTDQDGKPDSTQPLYRARNGDRNKGENPARIYLERSTHAAEAQLGKSDYAASLSAPNGPTDNNDYRQPWSLLATTPATNIPAGIYKSLTVLNTIPYATTSYELFNTNLCFVYKPDSLATIKQSTQKMRRLELNGLKTLILQIQGGCSG